MRRLGACFILALATTAGPAHAQARIGDQPAPGRALLELIGPEGEWSLNHICVLPRVQQAARFTNADFVDALLTRLRSMWSRAMSEGEGGARWIGVASHGIIDLHWPSRVERNVTGRIVRFRACEELGGLSGIRAAEIGAATDSGASSDWMRQATGVLARVMGAYKDGRPFSEVESILRQGPLRLEAGREADALGGTATPVAGAPGLLAGETPLHLLQKVRASDRAALNELAGRAERGDAEAQFQLGRAHSFGSPILPADERVAAMWVRKAAEAGHVEAQSNLGYLYLSGRGVPKDGAQALSWTTKAAEAGFGPAQANLSLILQDGQVTAKDEARAFEWMKRAADQGLAQAQLELGVMHGQGIGTAQDHRAAMLLYLKPAEQGNENAMANLGFMYLNGEGVDVNHAEALKWLKRPAASGDRRAGAAFLRACREAPALCRD